MPDSTDLMVSRLTAEIVSAYVSKNVVPAEKLPDLINAVQGALLSLGTSAEVEPEAENRKPAVPIRKSVTPDYIICLEDGKKLTMLKRYLRSNFNMTPDEYRTRWGLPPDYPMIAPNYAARRSELALQSGLGRHGRGDQKD